MNRFDDMVNSHEVEAYEILSTKLHEQLRQDKNRKPKKHLLTTEVGELRVYDTALHRHEKN